MQGYYNILEQLSTIKRGHTVFSFWIFDEILSKLRERQVKVAPLCFGLEKIFIPWIRTERSFHIRIVYTFSSWVFSGTAKLGVKPATVGRKNGAFSGFFGASFGLFLSWKHLVSDNISGCETPSSSQTLMTSRRSRFFQRVPGRVDIVMRSREICSGDWNSDDKNSSLSTISSLTTSARNNMQTN